MPRVVTASAFFPRGGSAHVVRSLARELPAHGWDVTVLSGSRTDQGHHADARVFYGGLDVRPLDFTAALRAPDPLAPAPGAAPMHASFEDRPGAPDPVAASLDDAAFERQVAAWCRALEDADAASADVLHLHHLTPINEAAARVAPHVPVVAHLHGTELLMLERIASGDVPASWAHARAWARRMRRWAAAADRAVLLSESARARVAALLDVEPRRCAVLPNGFDPGTFTPADPPLDTAQRLARWRRALVESPRGWRPGGGPGSVAYAEEDLAAIAAGEPVLLYVGRFTEVKRLPLLVAAHARARREHGLRAPLVIVGGHVGEHEGEHPVDAVERLGARDVLLAGWHDHDELPALLHAADVLVLPSVREQFGQVLVEAMACGLAPVAVDRHGPAGIVRDGETGWLVEPDDEDELARALTAAGRDHEERRARAARARADAVARFGWPALAERFAGVLDGARDVENALQQA